MNSLVITIREAGGLSCLDAKQKLGLGFASAPKKGKRF